MGITFQDPRCPVRYMISNAHCNVILTRILCVCVAFTIISCIYNLVLPMFCHFVVSQI